MCGQNGDGTKCQQHGAHATHFDEQPISFMFELPVDMIEIGTLNYIKS